MSDPRDRSHSVPEPGDQSGERGAGARAEAQRFWGEYARHTRPGGQRESRGPGYEAGNGHGGPGAHECIDWCPICRSAEILRSTASPELREQVQSLQRDALLTLRMLLDAYIERGERPARRGAAVEDIPIE
jgi:hypothetical protein